jgi:hypothetical protein
MNDGCGYGHLLWFGLGGSGKSYGISRVTSSGFPNTHRRYLMPRIARVVKELIMALLSRRPLFYSVASLSAMCLAMIMASSVSASEDTEPTAKDASPVTWEAEGGILSAGMEVVESLPESGTAVRFLKTGHLTQVRQPIWFTCPCRVCTNSGLLPGRTRQGKAPLTSGGTISLKGHGSWHFRGLGGHSVQARKLVLSQHSFDMR